MKTDRFRGHFPGHFRGHPCGTFRGAFRGESSKGSNRETNVRGHPRGHSRGHFRDPTRGRTHGVNFRGSCALCFSHSREFLRGTAHQGTFGETAHSGRKTAHSAWEMAHSGKGVGWRFSRLLNPKRGRPEGDALILSAFV